LTKHHDDLLKYRIDENFVDAKIEITPQLIDNTLNLCTADCLHFDSDIKTVVSPTQYVVKPKTVKKTQPDKSLHDLHDMDNYDATEKVLNIALDLYQMENY
jgi:hypothetical protein